MKVKIFFAIFLLFPFFLSCSLFRSKPMEESETASLQSAQPAGKTQQQSTATKTSSQASPSSTQRVVSAPTQASSADQNYVVNELTFEVKKLSAELKHVRAQLQDLQANSQMWMNPLAMYDKEIITDNGTSIFGKIIYQDDNIVKVETLIGYLVLEKASIVRVITNIPEEPAQKYIPAELASDLDQSAQYPQVSQAPYVSKTTEPAQMPESAAKTPNCVLVGNINERKDRSGNTVFSGEVKNIGARRADFVKVNEPESGPSGLKQAVQAAGNSKVIVAGGAARDPEDCIQMVKQQLELGGTAGGAIGRNIFQHSLKDAIDLLRIVYAVISLKFAPKPSSSDETRSDSGVVPKFVNASVSVYMPHKRSVAMSLFISNPICVK